MFTVISLPILVCSLALVFDDAQTPSGISMQTAITVILAVTVVYCARKIMEMHERINALESRKSSSDAKSSESEKSARIPSEVVAAISAAVVATYGRNARIVKMNHSAQESHAWSVEGRRHIFHSHSVR